MAELSRTSLTFDPMGEGHQLSEAGGGGGPNAGDRDEI